MLSFVLALLAYSVFVTLGQKEQQRQSRTVPPTCCECLALDSPNPFFVSAGGINRLACEKACQEHKSCPGRCLKNVQTGMCEPSCINACAKASQNKWLFQSCHMDANGECFGIVSCKAPPTISPKNHTGFCNTIGRNEAPIPGKVML